MKIQIRARGVALTKDQRALAERRMSFALARFGDRIDRVLLHVSRQPHPSGAGDKRCRIEVTVRPRAVLVEHTAEDVLAAVDRAARLAARSVARVLEQERIERERSSSGPGPAIKRSRG